MINNKLISIIGSGISGLICALILAKSSLCKGYIIQIFENEDRAGGRALSIKFNNSIIDLGAGRFSPTFHPNVSALTNELGKIIEIFPFTKIVLPHPHHHNLKKILTELKPKIKSTCNESFYQFLIRHVGIEKSQNIVNALGYDSLFLPEISPKIAYHIIEMHPETQCFSDNDCFDWFNLVEGFSSLIYSLYEMSIDLGVKFYFNHKLVHFQNNLNNTQLCFSNLEQSKILINSEYTVLTLPPTALSLLNINFPNEWTDFTYGSISLFKGFLFFESPWWKDYGFENKVTIVDNPLRKIYFKSDKYIFFYTDNTYSNFWNEKTQKGESEFLNTVMSLMSKALNISIIELPKPINHFFKFWKHGVEFAKENSLEHPKVLSKNNGKIISTSDAYTSHSGWMEGAIIAGRNGANFILKQLEKSN
ncbi:FAD-dependent oxidoreductase [Pigmentibacter ruber]|uniref:FAD-dependent oxidoreductase n=1 Tax=Pigmentibacter ruber TaxID=2683196 RepID=UPI00131BDAD9|nr:FAD-dependent oxidoreductase [Pigmentibacter ruber]